MRTRRPCRTVVGSVRPRTDSCPRHDTRTGHVIGAANAPFPTPCSSNRRRGVQHAATYNTTRVRREITTGGMAVPLRRTTANKGDRAFAEPQSISRRAVNNRSPPAASRNTAAQQLVQDRESSSLTAAHANGAISKADRTRLHFRTCRARSGGGAVPYFNQTSKHRRHAAERAARRHATAACTSWCLTPGSTAARESRNRRWQ